jgi:hypothetical protein
MSKNSQHALKMNKRFEVEEKRRRERMGLPTAAPNAPEPQPEPIGEVLLDNTIAPGGDYKPSSA